MQNSQLQTKYVASPLNGIRHRWNVADLPQRDASPLDTLPMTRHNIFFAKSVPLEPPPMDTPPLRGSFCFFSQTAHIRTRSTDSTFQGETIIEPKLRHPLLGSTLIDRALLTRTLLGRVLSLCSIPVHIGHLCNGSTTQGGDIIKTPLFSFAGLLKPFVYAVIVTTQTKALRTPFSGCRKQLSGDDTRYHYFQEEK